jgi:ElaB/YqjD/DUF883 family membrane-anchored ribosome-binding protein
MTTQTKEIEKTNQQSQPNGSYTLEDISHIAGDVMKDSIDKFKTGSKKAYQNGVKKAGEWERSFEGAVKKRPLMSVGIAAGVGACIGLLLSRRKKVAASKED